MDTLVIFTLGLVRSGSEVIEVPPLRFPQS